MKNRILSLVLAFALAATVPAGTFAADSDHTTKTVAENTDITEEDPDNESGNEKIDLSECTVEIPSENVIYDGKEKQVEVTVKYGETVLEKDLDYSVSYENNIEVGKASVTITGMGNYTGSKTLTFKIVPKKLAAPVITKTSATCDSVTLTWKKVKGATGYAVLRSDKKNGTYTRIKVLNKLTYTDKKVTDETKYYYKVRAYEKINGQSYRGYESEAKAVKTKKDKSGWKYVNGYKLYYDKNGKLVKDVSSIIGKQSSYVVKVNKQMNCVTIYAKDGKKGYIIPVKAFPCSTGTATPITTAKTPAKYRWHELMGGCYGQWCTRIKQGFLFHSVMYGSTKNNTLSVSAYNKLGTTASHGCIRLRAGDAKWIYDNCKLGTTVIIYNSSNPGPLGKPSVEKLPYWHTWDPTDPTAKNRCKEKGCH